MRNLLFLIFVPDHNDTFCMARFFAVKEEQLICEIRGRTGTESIEWHSATWTTSTHTKRPC